MKVLPKNLLREMRLLFRFKFLFYPTQQSFQESYIDIFFDIIQKNKNISYIKSFLKELVQKKIISANGIKEFSFNLGSSIFYDVQIQNYDGLMYSRGTSKNREEAYAKAVGELFERQNTQFSDIKKNIISASLLEMQEMKKNFVNPESYNKPTLTQRQSLLKDYFFDELTTFQWLDVKDFVTGESVYILRQDAYWGSELNKKEPYITNMSTHGCGGGYSLKQAEEAAIFEIIQRDTFFKYWYFNKVPKKISLESLPKESDVLKTVKELQKNSFTVELLDMTELAGLPTVTCVLYKETTGWFLGASTSFSKLQAVERSIQESFSTYMWFFQTVKSGGYVIDTFLKDELKKDFLDTRVGSRERCLLWGSKWFKDRQDQFLIKGDFISFTEDERSNTFSLKDYIKDKYKECYINHTSSPELDAYDYFVVKVVIPNAYGLFLDEKATLAYKDDTYPHNTSIHPFP